MQAPRRGATRRACTRCASRTTDGGGSGGSDDAPANRRWAQMRERSPAPTPPAPCPPPPSAARPLPPVPALAGQLALHAPGRLLHLVLVHPVLRRAGPAVLVPAPALALFQLRSRVLPCSARVAPVVARAARLARTTTAAAAAAASPAALWLRRRPAARVLRFWSARALPSLRCFPPVTPAGAAAELTPRRHVAPREGGREVFVCRRDRGGRWTCSRDGGCYGGPAPSCSREDRARYNPPPRLNLVATGGGDVGRSCTCSWSRAAAVPPGESASTPAVEPASCLPLAGAW